MPSEILRILIVGIGVVNSGLLLALLTIYVKNYRRIKSGFTLGLLFFASITLLETMLSTIFFVFIKEFHVPRKPLYPILFLNLLLCVAYSILLKITWE